MMAYPELHTKRLRLRELRLSDGPLVYRLFSNPEVTRYMDIEPCKSLKEAEEIILFHLEDSGCRYGIFLKDSDIFLGTAGYHCWEQGDRSKAEIGFDLDPVYWGQGYMSEALEALIGMGFERMDLDLVEATVDRENLRSQRLMHKLRFLKAEELKDGLFYFTRSNHAADS